MSRYPSQERMVRSGQLNPHFWKCRLGGSGPARRTTQATPRIPAVSEPQRTSSLPARRLLVTFTVAAVAAQPVTRAMVPRDPRAGRRRARPVTVTRTARRTVAASKLQNWGVGYTGVRIRVASTRPKWCARPGSCWRPGPGLNLRWPYCSAPVNRNPPPTHAATRRACAPRAGARSTRR